MQVIIRILLAIIAALISANGDAVLINDTLRDHSASSLVANSNRDEIIEMILSVSGIRESLQKLEEQMVPKVNQISGGSREEKETQGQMQKIYADAFPQNGFVYHVRNAMIRNYDERRYAHLLELMSKPLSKRMVEIESAEPASEEFQKFISQIATQSLSSDRIRLIQELDTATHNSALLISMTIASIESNAIIMADDCNVDVKRIKKKIANNRTEFEKANRSTVQVMLAFTYRKVSDADLDKYISYYNDKDSMWLQDFVQKTVEVQFKSDIENATPRLKRLIQSRKPKKTMFAPKCSNNDL